MPRRSKKSMNKADFLLSTDTLSGYGLDLIFQIAKEQWFHGIDLAMWKNFDAWSIEYVEWLVKKYIIKKYSMYLGFDIVHVTEEVLENQFIRKMANFIPYLSVVYLSDVDKHGNKHLPLWEGELKLPMLMKKFKQFEYDSYFSLDIS